MPWQRPPSNGSHERPRLATQTQTGASYRRARLCICATTTRAHRHTRFPSWASWQMNRVQHPTACRGCKRAVSHIYIVASQTTYM